MVKKHSVSVSGQLHMRWYPFSSMFILQKLSRTPVLLTNFIVIAVCAGNPFSTHDCTYYILSYGYRFSGLLCFPLASPGAFFRENDSERFTYFIKRSPGTSFVD